MIRKWVAVSIFCLLSLLAVGETRAEGFGVYKEGKGVVLKVDGQKFSIGTGGGSWSYDWLYVDKVVVSADSNYARAICTNFLCPEHKGWSSGFAANHIKEIKVILDKEDEKVVYIKVKAYNNTEKKIVESYSMEMNLRIKKGFPCLFICQRVTNLSDSPKKISFGSYARSISTYAGADLKEEKMPRLGGLERGNFIWAKRKITEKTKGSEGLGIISFIPTSFSAYAGHIYFNYAKGTVEEESYLESKWAVMAAKTPEEVKDLYEKIKDVKLDCMYYEISKN